MKQMLLGTLKTKRMNKVLIYPLTFHGSNVNIETISISVVCNLFLLYVQYEYLSFEKLKNR